MKSKLTLTIEKSLIPLAKQYARTSGRSLSGLVEESLAAYMSGSRQSFSSRWKGRFKVSESDLDSERFRYLQKKYL